jgi:Dolichyl-phosphate-mannose-protein mannosyltransferase
MTRERLTLGLLLAATFVIRAIHPDQPIVENYVGRQIPTAMVARNLERGSGFLRPQLDTGPFPNLFLVEPPIYAQVVVAARPLIGFDLEATGRLVSAAATTLAAWGLFGLVRRREGSLTAFVALGSFCCFPVMIRYGRAFQPDALMLGCVLAGLRGWDEYEDHGNWRWAVFGGFVLAIGLALKVTVAWALVPFVLIVRRWPIGWRFAASVAMLMPALAWYLYAWNEIARADSGSLASFDNANLWARSLSPENWLRFSTIENLARGLVVRSFTPIGFVLALWGLLASGIATEWHSRRVGLALPVLHQRQGKPYPTGMPEAVGPLDRMWLGWGIGCALSVVGLASKWHHAYYWMVVAPLASVLVARGLVGLAGMGKLGRPTAGILGSFCLGLCFVQSASTWRTPVEWAKLVEAANLVASLTTEDQWVIAPEALLHYAGRRGFRLEFDPAACRRAAYEWAGEFDREPLEWDEALVLTDFYQDLHSEMFAEVALQASPTRRSLVFTWDHTLAADVGPVASDGRRRAWREAIRKRPRTKVLIDKPGMMIAELR